MCSREDLNIPVKMRNVLEYTRLSTFHQLLDIAVARQVSSSIFVIYLTTQSGLNLHGAVPMKNAIVESVQSQINMFLFFIISTLEN